MRKIKAVDAAVKFKLRSLFAGGNAMKVVDKAVLHPCVAHRGYSGMAPENTLAAFRLALSRSYVHWMELDVHLSKDGVPVVIHDGTLKRTTNGTGRVRDYTAEQLGRMDAGSWFHPQFSSEGVPTLEQALQLAAGRCRLNVELKGDEPDRARLAARTADVIRSARMARDTVVTSFLPELLVAVRDYDPNIRTGLIIDARPADLVPTLVSLGATYLSIGYRHLTGAFLHKAAEAGIEVMAWTVNSPSDMRKLAGWPEAFQICTNYPDRWQAVVQERNNRE